MPSRRLSALPPRRPISLAPPAPVAADAPGINIVYAVRGCVIGHIRNMTICAWNAAPEAQHVEAFMALAAEITQTYPLCSNISLVMRDADLPEAEARVALERLTSEYARFIHSVALVIDGSGFRASIIRSFLTGLHLLRGNGYRCKTFGKPTEANPWLLPPHNADTGITLTEREMQEACEVIFARMAQESAPHARPA